MDKEDKEEEDSRSSEGCGLVLALASLILLSAALTTLKNNTTMAQESNEDAVRNLCTAIASSFYPDKAAAAVSLQVEGLDPQAAAQVKDARVLRASARLVMGYAETSRSEGGTSVGTDRAAVLKSLKMWCRAYGVDPVEIDGLEEKVIKDGTHLW